mmetsp:Transcript_34929/g.78921  ORF Transcript_34929/g.78921 Transcript_34929/m.78921 type:complete len:209 (-) Transcript_34929:234-860(-)
MVTGSPLAKEHRSCVTRISCSWLLVHEPCRSLSVTRSCGRRCSSQPLTHSSPSLPSAPAAATAAALAEPAPPPLAMNRRTRRRQMVSISIRVHWAWFLRPLVLALVPSRRSSIRSRSMAAACSCLDWRRPSLSVARSLSRSSTRRSASQLDGNPRSMPSTTWVRTVCPSSWSTKASETRSRSSGAATERPKSSSSGTVCFRGWGFSTV